MAVASAVKTTLGPKGMDKMMVSDLKNIVITNDGATILQEMNVEHPVAKIMVDIAKTQDKEVGDGTMMVVLAGELLRERETCWSRAYTRRPEQRATRWPRRRPERYFRRFDEA